MYIDERIVHIIQIYRFSTEQARTLEDRSEVSTAVICAPSPPTKDAATQFETLVQDCRAAVHRRPGAHERQQRSILYYILYLLGLKRVLVRP